MYSHDPTFEALPNRLAIFPLAGVLLLPRGKLPLNIFEPRYLAMVDDALATDRLIGMIQPRTCGGPLYDIGCAGRISSFAEAEGGRYLITLTGVCRFKITTETTGTTPYRTAAPDWGGYAADLEKPPACIDVDRARLCCLLRSYFTQQGMSCDWEKVDLARDMDLLTALAMICPLKASEKQALLESPDIRTRTELFMTMLDMAVKLPVSEASDSDGGCCH